MTYKGGGFHSHDVIRPSQQSCDFSFVGIILIWLRRNWTSRRESDLTKVIQGIPCRAGNKTSFPSDQCRRKRWMLRHAQSWELEFGTLNEQIVFQLLGYCLGTVTWTRLEEDAGALTTGQLRFGEVRNVCLYRSVGILAKMTFVVLREKDRTYGDRWGIPYSDSDRGMGAWLVCPGGKKIYHCDYLWLMAGGNNRADKLLLIIGFKFAMRTLLSWTVTCTHLSQGLLIPTYIFVRASASLYQAAAERLRTQGLYGDIWKKKKWPGGRSPRRKRQKSWVWDAVTRRWFVPLLQMGQWWLTPLALEHVGSQSTGHHLSGGWMILSQELHIRYPAYQKFKLWLITSNIIAME